MGNAYRILVGIPEGTGRSEFDSQQGQGRDIFLFVIAPRPVLEPTQPPVCWVQGIKRPVREADHSPLSSAEVKNAWYYTFTPQYVFMPCGTYLSKGTALLCLVTLQDRDPWWTLVNTPLGSIKDTLCD
jgi:hypothetical protein